MITDSPSADRIGAKARARNRGPRKFVSTLVRISSAVWVTSRVNGTMRASSHGRGLRAVA